MLTFLKSWASPLAILAGILFYRFLEPLSFLIPALLFAMIFTTYCSLNMSDVRFHRMHVYLLIAQLTTGILSFFLIRYFSPVTAEAVLICVMAPTAISSTVVAAMIGANIASLTLFTLLGNLLTALLLPLILPLLGIKGDMPFFMSFWFILRQLFSMLIAPLIGVLLLSRFLPRIYREVRKRRGISFYLWIISFAVVIARSTDFFLTYSGGNIHAVTSIIAGSLAFFMFQFLLGRKIGSLYDESLTGGQAMGHKNTVLAIWIAQSYMQPLASIGPTAYILWQAVFNGWQVWRYQSKKIRK